MSPATPLLHANTQRSMLNHGNWICKGPHCSQLDCMAEMSTTWKTPSYGAEDLNGARPTGLEARVTYCNLRAESNKYIRNLCTNLTEGTMALLEQSESWAGFDFVGPDRVQWAKRKRPAFTPKPRLDSRSQVLKNSNI